VHFGHSCAINVGSMGLRWWEQKVVVMALTAVVCNMAVSFNDASGLDFLYALCYRVVSTMLM